MKRVFRIAAKTAAALLAVAVLAVLAAWGAANTGPGQRWLAAQVEAALGTPAAPATVAGLHGAFPHDLRLARLELADGEGVWLTVTDARLAWNPLALLGGRLTVATLRAEGVTLARAPEGPAEPDAPADAPGEIALPRLPVSLRVDELAVARLDLGKAVLGRSAAFAVEGRAAAPQGAALSSTLSVRSLDGPGGTLDASATYHRDTRRLSLDTEAQAAPGGLFAALLDLPAEAGARLRLTGDGPVDAWAGRLSARVGATATAELDLAVTDATRLTVDGPVEPGALAPEPVPALLGGPVELALSLAREGGTGVRLDGSTLTTPTTEIALDGTLDAEAGTLDVVSEIALRDPAPVNALIAPATLTGPAATLTAAGPLAAPEVTVDARLDAVATPEGRVEGVRAEATYTPDGDPMQGRLTTTLTGERLLPPADPLLTPLRGESLSAEVAATLDLAANRVDAFDGELTLADARLTLNGGAELDTGLAETAFTARVPGLARFTEAVGFPVNGTATLDGQLRAGAESPLTATFTGGLDDAAWPEANAQALLGDSVGLAGEVTLAGDGGVRVTELLLEGANARASGDAGVDANGGLDGEITLKVPELAVLAEPLGTELAGEAEATAALAGTIDAPTAEIAVTSRETAAAGTPLGTLTAEAALSELLGDLKAEVTVATDATPAGPVSLATTLALTDPGLRLAGTTVEADGVTATSEALAVDFDSGTLDGAVTAEIAGLGSLARHFGMRARGTGTLTARLTPGSQNLALAGELRGLALPDQDIRAERVRVRGDLADVLADPSGTAELTLTGARSGPATLKSAEIRVNGSPAEAEVEIAAAGDAFGPFDVAAGATLRRDGEALAVELARLDGTVQGVDLALDEPAALRAGPDGLRVRDLALKAGGGTLTLDLAQTPERIDATAGVDALPLALARLVLPQPALTGSLDASLTLSGPLAEPTGTIAVDGRDIRVADTDLPAMALSVSGELGADALRLDASLTGLGEQPFEARGRLPMRLSLDPVGFAVEPDAPLDAEIAWAGEVAPLMPFVPVSGHALAGAGEIEARIDGTLADPKIGGHATLTDATYENLSSGTLFKQLNLRVEGTGDEVRVTELSARAGKGTVSGSGRVAFGETGADAVAVEIAADDATLVRRDELTARADAELRLQGSLTDLLLKGTLTVTRANALIPKRLPPSVRELKVTREVGGAGADGENGANGDKKGADAPPMRVGLDVTVTIPNRLFVRGNGIETEWQGELAVTGTADAPIVQGEISTVRGQVSVLNRVFVIREGLITFDGGREIDPTLQVRAEAEGEDITGIVLVSGRAAQPEIELESDPPLPEDAILSRLLFGKDPTELGALEAAQLGTAVAQLTGGGLAGGGFMERVRNLMGVDVLRLGGSQGDAAVSAGTYLSRDVFVGVEQGTTAESGAVRMELGVTDNISVESNVGATGDTNVGIQFKWDY